MKKTILIAPLLIILATAFSGWTDEAHHAGAPPKIGAALANPETSPQEKDGEAMHHHQYMMGGGMAEGDNPEEMMTACTAMMEGKAAMRSEMMNR